MKKSLGLSAFVSAFLASAFVLSSAAYADNNAFDGKYITEYLSDSKADITAEISQKLDEVNENSVNTVSGKM